MRREIELTAGSAIGTISCITKTLRAGILASVTHVGACAGTFDIVVTGTSDAEALVITFLAVVDMSLTLLAG